MDTINVSAMLDSLNIRKWNVVHAVADVSDRVANATTTPCSQASYLFNRILGVQVPFTDDVFARTAAKAMIREVVSAKCIVDDPQLFVDEALEYATNFVADPQWSFLWAQPDSDTAMNTGAERVQVSTEIDLKVEVRSDGKIKKGGKSLLAEELFRTKVLEAEFPLKPKEFIALLVSEVQLTSAGASTYRYNLWKKHGLTPSK